MNEEWKKIKGNHFDYEISNFGNVKTANGNYLSQRDNSSNYLRVRLSLQNKNTKEYFVHRLVTQNFIDNPDDKPFVNHIDGNKHNNRADNLEWCTRSENERHAWNIGLKSHEHPNQKGEKHPMHKLSEDDVNFIRANHKRNDPVYGSKPLSERFGVSDQTITDIVHNRTWK